MHIDLPTRADVERLAAARDPLSVTIYLPTSTQKSDAVHNRLRMRELVDPALAELKDRAEKRGYQEIEEHLNGLLDDDEFWTDLGNSLAVFVTSDGITEFRLPSDLAARVSVSDRFAITPLLRALTFPNAAFALALSQNSARLIEISAGLPPQEIDVPGLPSDAVSAVAVESISGRSHHRRLVGDEGRKVRLTQYARAVDHALRPFLNSESVPLVLAATEPMLTIYRGLCGYAHLAEQSIRGNADELTNAEIADQVRGVLDEFYAHELAELHSTYQERKNAGRGSADLSDLARAAAWGNLDTLVVDMDARSAGTVDDDGSLVLGDETGHDAIEEIARRAIATGARVLAVRAEDLPDGVEAAGILRYAPVASG